jgi:hypothetical protein
MSAEVVQFSQPPKPVPKTTEKRAVSKPRKLREPYTGSAAWKWWQLERKIFLCGVAQRLLLLRKNLGISEQQAADALNLRLRTYRKWERAEPHSDNYDGIYNLCETYDLSFEWFLCGRGSPHPRQKPPKPGLSVVK